MSTHRSRLDLCIFDSNAANPYSTELQGLLRAEGLAVDLIAGSDVEASVGGLRPTTGKPTFAELMREVRSVLRVAVSRRPTIIVWGRTYQKLIFILASALSRWRPAYVVHNPIPSRWPTGWRATVERCLLKTTHGITHSASLRAELVKLTGVDSLVAPHPLYMEWVGRWVPPRSSRDDRPSEVRVLLLGRADPDKFANLRCVLEAFEACEEPVVVRALLRPKLDLEWPTAGLVKLEDRSRDSWIADDEIGESLAWADLLLAPYEEVTESATVSLAIAANLAVAAFDGGALRESLAANAFAARRDYVGLARTAIRIAHNGETTTCEPLAAKLDRQVRSWLEVSSRIAPRSAKRAMRT